ncbi:ATP-binding protein [Dechloromonas agitata]|nr:sensor histidine kinase [Dechloromonas agitata]MDE1545603.1 ATP-binding protein [Dechloromonas agitata]
MKLPRWHLRTSLTLLLVAASAIAMLIAFALLLAYYQPRLAAQTRDDLGKKSVDLARRSETVLSVLQGQLELVASSLADRQSIDPQRQLNLLIRQAAFSAVYHLDPSGKVIHAAVSDGERKQAAELIGNDLANDRLRRQVMQRLSTVWSDKYLSPVSQRMTVAIGVWTGKDVLIGEIPLAYILETITESSNPSAWAIWVTDGYGDILADSEHSERVGVVNLASQPIFVKVQGMPQAIGEGSFEGKRYDMAAARSERMNWYFIVRSPAGLDSPPLRTAVGLGLTALVSLMLLSLLFAPLWAARTAQPINAIAERARKLTEGHPEGDWPRSSVIELNQLSSDLEHMAAAIREREQELEIIFESSPVSLLLTDPFPSFAFAKANAATLRLFGYPREELIGRNGAQLGFWKDPADRNRMLAQLHENQAAQLEAWLRRRDGSEFLGMIQARTVLMGGGMRTIWSAEDITELRHIEREVRELNVELEARVQKRTEELRAANTALSTTVEHLQMAQTELVRSEKLASLGSLVAGVAHELNTPIGNGVMAVSTLRGALKTFRERSAEGLKRSLLDSFVESVDTGSLIAERNLERAAELVTSFKQVAADQTTSQRRAFCLDEVVHEIALTLGPSLRHSVAQLNVDIPEGIRMESYPGPLGQIIANLITNATIHAFTDRQQGQIRIVALASDQQVQIWVGDDGVGIPANLLPRIFDPFVTSRMGRGGTGLGLHIAHNIAQNVLGGRISATSVEGSGTVFELEIPLVAPQPAEA